MADSFINAVELESLASEMEHSYGFLGTEPDEDGCFMRWVEAGDPLYEEAKKKNREAWKRIARGR